MPQYRLDLSIQEDGHPDDPQQPGPRSLVLTFTDDEVVMAASLRAAAEMLDPKDSPKPLEPFRARKAAPRRRSPVSGFDPDDEDDNG